MWGAVGRWGTSQGTGPLFTGVGGVVEQVTAKDLQNNTATVGTAYGKAGTVPYNSGASPRPSVGPFSASNYFQSAIGNPMNFAAAPYTIGVALTISSFPAAQVNVLSDSNVGLQGYYLLANTDGSMQFVTTSTTAAVPANKLTVGAINVVLFGVAAGGTLFCQINGGTTASTAGGTVTQVTTNPSLIGAPIGGATAFLTGSIFEVFGSTAIPSAAAFNAIYTQVLANQ